MSPIEVAALIGELRRTTHELTLRVADLAARVTALEETPA